MKLRSNRVLIKVDPIDLNTKIVIPDTVNLKEKVKTLKGEVVEVGPGKVNEAGILEPMEVKVKDRVIFSSGSGVEVKLDTEDYLVLAENEILAIE